MDRRPPAAALVGGGLLALAVGKRRGATAHTRGPPPCQRPGCTAPATAPGYDTCEECGRRE